MTSTSGAQDASLRRNSAMAALQRCHLATLSASVSPANSGRTGKPPPCRLCSTSQCSGGTISCGPCDIAIEPTSSAILRLVSFVPVRRGDLMRQRHLATLLRRLQHGNADLKGRLPPAPVREGGAILCDRLLQLAQLGAAPLVETAGDLLAARLRIDEEPAWRLPNDAALAGHDGQAEERLIRALADGPLLGGARI